MSTEDTTPLHPKAICPKCLTHYNALGTCETPTCSGVRLLPIRSNTGRVGETIDGEYTLLEEIGSAGMGSVYRALQHTMEREVAVKFLHPSLSQDLDAVKRFLLEAKQASKLNHPHIITLFNFGQSENDELYLVMELLEGMTLGSLIHKEGQVEVGRALSIISQICGAVHYAHAEGVIHRDLKPDNLFIVQKEGQQKDFVKVLDFGLAKLTTQQSQSAVTATGVVCGTPAYMSPEQAMSRPLDERSDIYSIGIILYEMLAGSRPFSADSPVELLLAHVNQRPPAIRESDPDILVPKAVESVLMQTLAKDPEERPDSANNLRNLLQEAMLLYAENPTSTALPTVDTLVGVPTDRLRKNEALGFADTLVSDPEVDTQTKKRIPRLHIAAMAVGLLVGCVGYYAITSMGNRTNPEKEAPKAGNVSTTETGSEDEATARETATPPADGTTNPTVSPTALKKPTPDTGAPESKTQVAEMLEIVSEPPGATVRRNGIMIGETPLTTSRPKDGATPLLLFSKPGYHDLEERLSIHSPTKMTYQLKKKRRGGTKVRTPPNDSTVRPAIK